MNEGSKRQLAAILFADIQGYTALMQNDEAQAANLLRRFQKELSQEVKSQNGKIINFYGDGALCTFTNPLEALRCAMAFQRAFRQEPAVPVRVGIHMGTVVLEEGKAYGDSINITSRLETLGIPGSILLSKRVQDELKNQADFTMQSLGRFNFKNVDEPMEVFALANADFVVPNRRELRAKLKTKGTLSKIKWLALTFAGLVLLTSMVALIFSNQKRNIRSIEGNARSSLQRLAVLPFSNVRDDPNSDFLGLALADEIIGDLSYMQNILVRPSSSIRKYTETSVDVPTAGNELRVDYILVGSYLREDSAIRMSIELVGVNSNELIWREEIEETYQNAFQLQDIVSEKVLQGLQIQFSEDEIQRRTADISEDPLAYEYYLRALAYPSTIEENRLAVSLLEKSIELDSLFAPAWSELGWRTKQLAAYSLGEGQQISQAELLLQKALTLNADLLSALSSLVAIYVETGRTDKAVETGRHVLAINPNSAENHIVLGYVYRYAGSLEEAERAEEVALSLDPDNPRIAAKIGMTQLYLGQYQKALDQFENNSQSPFSLAWQGQIHLRLGNYERALELFNTVIEMDQQGVGHWVKSMKNHIEGTPEKGLQVLQVLEKGLVDAEQFYNIANLYGLLGYKEHCIRTLRKTVSRGFFSFPVLQSDSFLDSVRGEPEFHEVLEEARIKHEAFQRRYFNTD